MIAILLTMVSAVGGVYAAAPDGIVYTHSTRYFSVTLPSSWAGLYRIEETP